MRIALLSQGGKRLYSNRRLLEAAESRGHEIKVVPTLKCYMDIASHQPSVHLEGKELDFFDAVIPRIGASATFYGCAVLRQFEMMGTYPLNESVAITRSRDKLRSLQIMSRAGIGLPLTGFAASTRNTQHLIEIVGGAPLVVKLLEGTQGQGIVLAETRKAAETIIDAFRQLRAEFPTSGRSWSVTK
jgi:ribosomal protein S6--L-glutamate ligase